MFPRHRGRGHRGYDTNVRQKKTNEFVNLTVLYNIANTINFNNETTRRNSTHKVCNF